MRKNQRQRVAKKVEKDDEVISPLSFFDFTEEEKKPKAKAVVTKEKKQEKQGKGFFVIGTGFGSGKTIGTCILGALMKNPQCSVGFMKIIECAGESSKFLLTAFGMDEERGDVSPYFLPFDLPPQIALRRRKMRFSREKIVSTYKRLAAKYDYVFVESCGGLMTPITDKISTADIAKTLELEAIVVSENTPSGLNHAILTIEQAKGLGIEVKGTLFSCLQPGMEKDLYDAAKAAFKKTGVPSIGVIPFLEKISRSEVMKKCRGKMKLPILTSDAKPERGPDQHKGKEAEAKAPAKRSGRPRRFPVKRRPHAKKENIKKDNG